MKLLSMFSGIGAFEKALKNLNIDHEIVGYSEIDKYASKAYSILHNIPETYNLGDIKAIKSSDLPQDLDLVVYGFPCQDISVAGKRIGLKTKDGSLSRSGLFFEALRIITETKPKIAIAENVKALTYKTFSAEFKAVLDGLTEAGYENYWKVLNARDYGIPQNRERIFIVSVRKDIEHGFDFPEKQELKLCLGDLLEDTVDEKYYLSERLLNAFIAKNKREEKKREEGKGGGFFFKVTDASGVARTISTRTGRPTDTYIKQIANIVEEKNFKNPQRGRLYDPSGISPTLNTAAGGGLTPKILNKESIRKLTPKECFRLMSFDDSDFNCLREAGFSDTQLVKMAGNSIVVKVLEALFESLKSQYPEIESTQNPSQTASDHEAVENAQPEEESKPKGVDPRNTLNDLTGTEWLPETKSFFYQKGLGAKHPHAQIERQHPAPYSYQDIEHLVTFFTKSGMHVLDPFGGIGSTAKACDLNGRICTSIELSKRWHDLAIERLETEVEKSASARHIFINDNCVHALSKMETGTFDFMVTSPPYWSILNKKPDYKVKESRLKEDLATNYSDDDPNDLANIADYEEFLDTLVDRVFLQCARVLRDKGYMCIVVSDFRNKSEFVSFHSDLIQRMNGRAIADGGILKLQGVKALLQNHKSLLPYGYPFAYVENIHHQYILIFRKYADGPKRKAAKRG